MLRRNRLEIANINHWTGDRAHGGKRYGGRMSNRMLMSSFAHILGYPAGRLNFRISDAYKPAFSVYYTCQRLHETMAKDRFQVHPRCKNLIKSIKFWTVKRGTLDPNSEFKHSIDALRYASMPLISRSYRTPMHSKIQLR